MSILKHIALLLLLTHCCLPQSRSALATTQEPPEAVVKKILRLYNAKDQQGLNRFIHPDIGLYFLYRPGTIDFWSNEKGFCFKNDCTGALRIPSWIATSQKTQKLATQYQLWKTNEPIVGCESVSRNGLFLVNYKNTNRLLSETMQRYADVRRNELSKQELEQVKRDQEKVSAWEKQSVRIVLAQKKDKNNTGEAFVFHLANIGGRWYITVMDYISFDCSV